MKLLALETSTDRLSVGVQHGEQQWWHEGAGGAQASAALIPAIEALMARAGLVYADLDAIVFGRGPGSFTGLRTACAVAQGLAWGANLPVLPVDTLMAVAEEARLAQAQADAQALGGRQPPVLAAAFPRQDLQVLALLDARMGELYVGRYRHGAAGWTVQGSCELMAPTQLVVQPEDLLAGNALEVHAQALSGVVNARHPAWPTARALLSLAPALWSAGHAVDAAQALPLYIRDKVAQTTEERAAARAARMTP